MRNVRRKLLVPGRSADVFDLMADFVGSVLFVTALWVYQRLTSRRTAPDSAGV